MSHHALVHFCQIHTWSEEEHMLMPTSGLNRPPTRLHYGQKCLPNSLLQLKLSVAAWSFSIFISLDALASTWTISESRWEQPALFYASSPLLSLGLHLSVRVMEPPDPWAAPENTNLKLGTFCLFLENANPTIQDHLTQPVQSITKP